MSADDCPCPVQLLREHDSHQCMRQGECGERPAQFGPPQAVIGQAIRSADQQYDITPALATRLQEWLLSGRDIVLLIGGPDGLSDDCLRRSELRWSLSGLTLPHALVRVVLAEQLYRAWTIISGHPYHRS